MNEKLVNTKFEDDTFSFLVNSITTVSGDCDVTQRKGKVLCIYDMKLVFAVEGSKKDEEEAITATITIDEFVHDQDDDEYVFTITSDYSTEIKKLLLPLIKSKLQQFQNDLIKAHESDVQHATGQ